MTEDLSEFLRARLDEDERVARECWADHPTSKPLQVELHSVGSLVGIGQTRMLAEVEAKRRILERLEALVAALNAAGQTMPSRESGELVDGILPDLALPYADHPDYRQEWSA